MNEKMIPDKIGAYAMALPGDISATWIKQVRDGKLCHFFVGTVYGCMVATEQGTYFDTLDDARHNAGVFVEQCAAIQRKRDHSIGGKAC